MYCTLYFHFPWHALPAHGTLCYLWQTFFWQPAISIVCKWEGCRTRQKPLENGILEVGGSLMEAMRHLFAACIACSILHWTFYGICTSSNVLNWLLILMEELKIAHTRRRLLNWEISIFTSCEIKKLYLCNALRHSSTAILGTFHSNSSSFNFSVHKPLCDYPLQMKPF